MVTLTRRLRQALNSRALEIWGSHENLEEELKKQEQVKKIFDQCK